MLLHQLVPTERTAAPGTGVHALTHEVEGALCLAEPAQAALPAQSIADPVHYWNDVLQNVFRRTAVTEAVYRKQIRPVIQTGATAMDEIFRAAPNP